jgi:hypothetical protein
MEGSFDGLSLKSILPPLVERRVTLPLDDGTNLATTSNRHLRTSIEIPERFHSSTSSSGGHNVPPNMYFPIESLLFHSRFNIEATKSGL